MVTHLRWLLPPTTIPVGGANPSLRHQTRTFAISAIIPTSSGADWARVAWRISCRSFPSLPPPRPLLLRLLLAASHSRTRRQETREPADYGAARDREVGARAQRVRPRDGPRGPAAGRHLRLGAARPAHPVYAGARLLLRLAFDWTLTSLPRLIVACADFWPKTWGLVRCRLLQQSLLLVRTPGTDARLVTSGSACSWPSPSCSSRAGRASSRRCFSRRPRTR